MIIQYRDVEIIKQENPGKKVVLSDGTFDLLHVGHLEHLKSLTKYGDVVVIGVMSDEWVRAKKGDERPLMNQQERAMIIDSLKGVDYVVVLYDNERQERIKTSDLLKSLHPEVFVTADSTWRDRINEVENAKTRLEVVERIVPKVDTSIKPISTTNIINKILDLYRKQ